jgi:outer membrane protein TolC
MDSYEKERFAVKTAYDASNDLLGDLRNKMENAGSQFRITDELFRFGGRTKRQWADARLDYVVSQLTYEEAIFDNYYASAREILFVEKDSRPEGGEKILLSGLQEALDLALRNSREIKKYEDALALEEESLNYYKMIRVNGSVSKGYYVMDNKGSQKRKTVQTTGGVISAEVDLVNNLMVRKQELRVELARKDLEQAKFDLNIRVVDSYCNYLASLAEYSQVGGEYEKQKAVLAGIEELYTAGAVAHVDYLKQKEFVESLLQKTIDVRKYCEGYRSNLGIVVGGLDPRFSIMNVEVYEGHPRR